MATTLTVPPTTSIDQSVVAAYPSHFDAEDAVRQLSADGVPVNSISIIGRNYETQEDIQGFYRPGDAALDGAGVGAWFGGIFGLLAGAMGFFVLPAVGALLVLGPLAGLIAGAVGGAGVGALINALIALGIPRDQALKYQTRLTAGEFLVVVHGSESEVNRAHSLLQNTKHSGLETHTRTL